MKQSILNNFSENKNLIYKGIIVCLTTFLIVYFFPKGSKFRYEFRKGQTWQHKDLYAPFNFAIQKTKKQISDEKQKILKNSKLWFAKDTTILNNSLQKLYKKTTFDKHRLKALKTILTKIYHKGFLEDSKKLVLNSKNPLVIVKTGKNIQEIPFNELLQEKNILSFIQTQINKSSLNANAEEIINFLSETVKPNIRYDAVFTEKEREEKIANISHKQGLIKSQEIIISKGEMVEGEKWIILNSLKNEYQSHIWSNYYHWLVFGYGILVLSSLLTLLFFFKKEKPEIFYQNSKITFIFFNMLLLIFCVTFAMKYEGAYVYIVPLSIIPIVLKTFFDAQVALFTHVLTLLLLGFIVPNSFEFLFLQIIAGIISILNIEELYKRANLFVTIAKITLVYMITYVAFSLLHEGDIHQLNWQYFTLFILNGVLSLLTLFLIWLYEKMFGLVSDITLLELSNTSSPLLQKLNEQASGTFQHSIQVSNLSEAAAKKIGANSLLVRTAALYHDIGKMYNPLYFIENQSTMANPHNDLSPQQSAKIIINHVDKGIEMAKKYNLPKCIIDFIKTHHGTSTVYYFLKKQEQLNEPFDKADFKYKGSIPFSKETAILMMCDAVEAACRSLKNPDEISIDNLIEKIFEGKIAEKQFENTPITFQEITMIKQVLKQKIKDIYHIRIQYPY